MQTERVTRSRARTLAAAGETPLLAPLPDKTPAGTTRTTRRRAAAAATAGAGPTPGGQPLAPVVLFDVTNDQDASAPAPQAPASPVEASSAPEPQRTAPVADAPAAEDAACYGSPSQKQAEHAAAAPAADEPPATPAHTVPASPAPPAPGATPTGLGLSSMPPLSPNLAMQLQSKTPAATPMGGVEVDSSRVASALHAAVQALEGSGADQPSDAAPADAPDALLFRGFGSPMKQEADSPDSAPVSIGGAIAPAHVAASPLGRALVAGEDADADATSGLSFAGAAVERELTLEEMMGTPFPSEREATPDNSTPTVYLASAARPAAAIASVAASPAQPAASAAVRVRTVQKAHPLTPSKQVVLEEERQDYIMKLEGAEEQVAAESHYWEQHAERASPAAPSPAPTELTGEDEEMEEGAQKEAAAAEAEQPDLAQQVAAVEAELAAAVMTEGQQAAAVPRARVASKVVVPSPNTFDPRSLRQLKREVSERIAAKQASILPAPDSEEEEEDGEDYIGTTAVGDALSDELGGLSLEPGQHGPLRGLPTPAGTHIRFGDDDEAAEVSPRQKLFLRGLPEPRGTHIRFD